MSKQNKILIKKGNQVLEVFEKAYEVVYKNAGYHLVDENADSNAKDPVDLEAIAEMSGEELKKVTNDDLKAYLDDLEIEYKSNATKDQLIALIVGEDDAATGSENDNPGDNQ